MAPGNISPRIKRIDNNMYGAARKYKQNSKLRTKNRSHFEQNVTRFFYTEFIVEYVWCLSIEERNISGMQEPCFLIMTVPSVNSTSNINEVVRTRYLVHNIIYCEFMSKQILPNIVHI